MVRGSRCYPYSAIQATVSLATSTTFKSILLERRSVRQKVLVFKHYRRLNQIMSSSRKSCKIIPSFDLKVYKRLVYVERDGGVFPSDLVSISLSLKTNGADASKFPVQSRTKILLTLSLRRNEADYVTTIFRMV